MASSRSSCVRSEWIEVVGRPWLNKKSSTMSTPFLVRQKIRVLAGGEAISRSYRACFFWFLSTQTICKSFSEVGCLTVKTMVYLLLDVLYGGASSSNSDTDIVLSQVLLGDPSHVLVKRGGEQEVLVLRANIDVAAAHDLFKVFGPVIMKHLIGFVKDRESQSVEGQEI